MSLTILSVLFGAQLFALIPGATAQVSNATCTPSYSWAENSRGQSPCIVASFLQGTCANGVFTVRALPPGRHYAGPTADLANPCYCSTVVYSLIAACGDCQGAMFEDWTDWRANCSTVSTSKFPVDIPPGTSVPHWAFLDVVTGDRYDPIRAQQDATASTVESTRTALSTSSSTYTPRPAPTKSRTKIGPIVGGVVGGLVFLALVGALVFFLIARRRQTKTAPSTTYGDGSQSGLASPPPMSQPTPVYPAPASFGGYPSEMTGSPSPKIYDPSDPSTFPSHAAPQRQSGYGTTFQPPSPGPDYTHANAVPLAYNSYQPPFEPQSPGTPEYTNAGHPYNRYNGAPEL